jgi:hypothetical protein
MHGYKPGTVPHGHQMSDLIKDALALSVEAKELTERAHFYHFY